MRKDITVAATPREGRGKNVNRRLRLEEKIPAVVYGVGKNSVALTVNPKEINRILLTGSGHNTIFDLAVEGGETEPVLITAWQYHPVKGKLLHIDMLRIDMSKRIKVRVPVHTTGDAKGVKQQGGLFENISRDVEIECLPDDIPESFTLDVTGLMLGQNLRAQDIPMTGTMKLLTAPEKVIAHVVAARGGATAEADAAAGAKAEPEVAKKGKKEEK
ncbi:MAG: 50S ribosomal protein L25 [Candidatus Solibacter sp.]|nr:50S ribosomal protein L25 [Candidatus Solibacter sp.]